MALPALPSGWTSYTPQQKISWFNSNGTTIQELVGAGVPESDITWMLSNGYNPPAPVVQQPIQQEPVYTQPEPIYQEPVYQEPVYQEPVYTPPVYTPPPAPTYNIFGLQWNSAAPLSTKQGYVQTLLQAGITGDQIKAKIAELDPANANQAAYDLLGIPSAPPPATTTNTTNTTNTTGLLGGGTTVTEPVVAPPTTTVVEQPRNTSQDAVTLMAAQLGLGLPNEWQYYTPQDKVNWFNANKVTEQTLRDYKVPESDISYAKTLGLGTTTAPPPSWDLPTGMTLPSGWSTFTGQQKVDWYNQNKVTADMLRAMGVPESDVQGAITLGLGKTTAPTGTTQPPAGTTQPPRTFNPADYMPPTFNLPATNFVPFATGGGQTSLAAPTTGFFYKTTPTEQVPFQFQSGAAGYTNLRPMTLEFGIPQAVSQVQQFQPGYFNQAGILQNYDWAKTNTQLAQQAAQQAQQQAAQDANVSQGGAMGGKIVGFTDYEEKPEGEVGYEKGGKIRSLLGPDPDGPDEGYAKLQRGEYVVRRKAVNKYGEDFLEALNEARMPKEKLKSLL